MSLHPELPEVAEVAHTPEPWEDLKGEILAGNDYIAGFFGAREFADAKRAVLSVNATKGISNEALEAGVIAELVQLAKDSLELRRLEAICSNPTLANSVRDTFADKAEAIEERLRNAIQKAGGDLQ